MTAGTTLTSVLLFFLWKNHQNLFFTGFDLLVLFEVRREWCENVRETYGEILCNF